MRITYAFAIDLVIPTLLSRYVHLPVDDNHPPTLCTCVYHRAREELQESLPLTSMAVKFRSLSVVVNASIPTELQTEKVLPANISLAVVDDDLGGAVDDNNVTVCVLSGTLVRG